LLISGLIGIGAIFIGLNSFSILGPTQYGVYERLGRVQDNIARPGLNFKIPLISNIEKYDVKVLEKQVDVAAATKDLQDLKGQVEVYFNIDIERLPEIRKTIGVMDQVIAKVVPIADEAFRAVSAQMTAEETITMRPQLRSDFDTVMKERLAPFGINYQNSSVRDLDFSAEFSKAVEEKQIAEQQAKRAVFDAQRAEQEAKARINKARGEAESQRLQAEALKAQGGELVIQREFIEKWNGQLPQFIGGGNQGGIPFLNLGNLQPKNQNPN
jgi:regulator of protease activity HflC (stomatin/prohibitin superfamily)